MVVHAIAVTSEYNMMVNKQKYRFIEAELPKEYAMRRVYTPNIVLSNPLRVNLLTVNDQIVLKKYIFITLLDLGEAKHYNQIDLFTLDMSLSP